MAFRGYFALNGIEIANSSRVIAHLGQAPPTDDLILGGGAGSCGISVSPDDPGLALVPASSVALAIDPGLASPPDGSRLYDPGLAIVDDCWTPSPLCGCTSLRVFYDDSWPGLQNYLADTIYRPELAPWYDSRVPESAEFGGVWVMDAKGFGPMTVARTITEMIGPGATAGPNRDTSRKLSFECLIIACTNAGAEYGLQWLACQLRQTATTDDSTLTYFNAHPADTAATPASLVRQLHGVVLTSSLSVTQQTMGGSDRNRQAYIYRASFELTALNPYAYLPPVDVPVNWTAVTVDPIKWSHAAQCDIPADCDPMPVLFSETCPPEVVNVGTNTPPPVCGGCMPVCEVDRFVFDVPTYEYPVRCSETAATLTITNNDLTNPLTLQAYWKLTTDAEGCGDDQFPVQIAGLPGGASITLDAVSGRYTARKHRRPYRPVGIVGTSSGAPWIPPIIDRSKSWQFVVIAPDGASFDVEMSLADKES